MKLGVINGPNLNLTGMRSPNVYGTDTLETITEELNGYVISCGSELAAFQSNHEGALVDEIQAAYGVYDGIVINPAAYTHTSVAILDALKAVHIPAVEVHLSNVSAREAFRQVSYAGMACIQTYAGCGFAGYEKAVLFLKDYLQKQ